VICLHLPVKNKKKVHHKFNIKEHLNVNKKGKQEEKKKGKK
jgi:hypothetical protein